MNYMSASDWIDEHPEDFDEVEADDLSAMRSGGVIWTLQIYPSTPIGFYRIHASTPQRAVDRFLKEVANASVAEEVEG